MVTPPDSPESDPALDADPGAVDAARAGASAVCGAGEPVETLDPVEAFALLGQEIRLQVVRALFAADPGADGRPIPFSEIADAVELRDAGHLYYHLDSLCPHFVEHCEDGYRLRRPGRRAIRLLRSGALTADADPDPMALADDCVRCGGGLELRYDDGFARVVCPDCGRWFVRFRFPAGGFAGRDADGVAAAFDARCRAARRLGNRGVCPLCSGPMDRRLVTGSSDCFGHPANLRYACGRCGCGFNSTVGAALADHTAVVSFLDDHGIDPGDRPLWALPFAFDPDCVGFQRADPPGAILTLHEDAERLRVVVGLDGAVIDTTRSLARDGDRGWDSADSPVSRWDDAGDAAIAQSPW